MTPNQEDTLDYAGKLDHGLYLLKKKIRAEYVTPYADIQFLSHKKHPIEF